MAFMKQTHWSHTGILLVAAGVVLAACSKPKLDNQEPLPDPTSQKPKKEPLAAYAWLSDGRATFRLPTKDLLLQGSLGGVRGQITLDTWDLSRSRATLELDLTTLNVAAADESGARDQYSESAQAWFGLGKGVPEKDRQQQRWASFRLTSLSKLSSTTPLDAQRVRRADAGLPNTVYQVHGLAQGELLLHGFRVQQEAPVTLSFSYVEPVTQASYPERIRIQTRSPFKISLLAHSILPRTEAGIVISEQVKELGKTMDSEVSVEFDFHAVRISR